MRRFFGLRAQPQVDLVTRLEMAKNILRERGFTPVAYESVNGFCAVGAYAKTFAKKDETAGMQLSRPPVREGVTLLNEATFIVTGGSWRNIEDLAICLNDLSLVLKVYDKAIELVQGRIARGEDLTWSQGSRVLRDHYRLPSLH